MEDHFGRVAGQYATYRPSYPAALFETLAGVVPARRSAWDCATGNGQAAVGLAPWFETVVASDGSRGQLEAARRHPRVRYVVARAEAAPFRSGSVDLVTVAQALHWLDLDRFWPEVRRVLVRDGVVAVWSYNLARVSPEVDREVKTFYKETVGPYWLPGREAVERGYRTLPFPFEELVVPQPDMTTTLTLDAFVGYVGTWSAVQRYREARGEDPLPAFRVSLAAAWGDPSTARVVRWPVALRVGR